jgi:hypothetical protein
LKFKTVSGGQGTTWEIQWSLTHDTKTGGWIVQHFVADFAGALACEGDYYQHHQKPKEKPQIEWLEFGLFSGGNEKVSPSAFAVERAQSDKDGSFRVQVRLTWGPPSKPWIWRVVVIVVPEDGHSVVDDVIFLKDENSGDVESRLSEILASGCNGGRWVGSGDQRSDSKQVR